MNHSLYVLFIMFNKNGIKGTVLFGFKKKNTLTPINCQINIFYSVMLCCSLKVRLRRSNILSNEAKNYFFIHKLDETNLWRK